MNEAKGVPTTTATDSPAAQQTLLRALHEARAYGAALAPGAAIEHIETHISHLFLAGPYVYKIKKAVDLGFLNFSSLAARRFYCQEELRLNRRFAPDLYLDVVAVTGTPAQPLLDGPGHVLEWVVKMRRFEQTQRLDNLLAAGRCTAAHVDELALRLAEFHGRAAVATGSDRFGTPQAVRRPAQENFVQIRPLLESPSDRAELEFLQGWMQYRWEQLQAQFALRKQAGHIRECHGDLHLANVAVVHGAVTLFDCLEFDENLRWIDTMSDVAFALMDFQHRGRADLARRLLDRYLAASGDYAGLAVLDFYRVYRALVRAKVVCMRARQADIGRDEHIALLGEYRSYIALAEAFARRPPPALLITHGVSGSGKSTGAWSALELIDAVCIRSDVERKRLLGFDATARTGSATGGGAYTEAMAVQTYASLLQQAQAAIGAGFSVIVDAAFLRREQRDIFRQRAQAWGVPFLILDFDAEVATLHARIEQRRRRGGDASEADAAVLERQLATREPLRADELAASVRCGAAADPQRAWAPLLQRLAQARPQEQRRG